VKHIVRERWINAGIVLKSKRWKRQKLE